MFPHVQVPFLSNWRVIDSPSASLQPGYTLTSVKETHTGLTASLDLAGSACNAFGTDIANLTVEVTYDSQTRCVDHRKVPMKRV